MKLVLQGILTGYVNVRGQSSSPLTFAVPFLAEQTVDLVIMPKTVPIMFSGGGNGKARLLLHGELIGRGKPYIREIRCDGFRVKWSASNPTPSKKSVLEIAFEPSGKRGQLDLKIQFELVTGKTIVLPAVLVRSRTVRD